MISQEDRRIIQAGKAKAAEVKVILHADHPDDLYWGARAATYCLNDAETPLSAGWRAIEYQTTPLLTHCGVKANKSSVTVWVRRVQE